MPWNYRVVKRQAFNDEWIFGVYPVYYNKDGDICLISVEPEAPGGETLEELRSHINRMLSAIGKPVLDYDKIEFAPMDEDGDNTEDGVDWNMCDETYIGTPDWNLRNFDNHVKNTRCC